MSTLLTHDGDTSPVTLADLDDDIRQGVLPPSAELYHPPWTGEAFKRLDTIEQLADAVDSPNARFAEHVRRWRFPWASTLVTLGTLGMGILQGLVAIGALDSAGLRWFFDHAHTGLEPLLIDGWWWSPWASQVAHFNAGHLLLNMAVVSYCGYRVERAMGPTSYLLVCCAAVAVGTFCVTAFSTLPVIGSSLFAYGLWSAQITVGFRMGLAVPSGWRGLYGWGTLKIFVPLFVAGLFSPEASHWGHLGGILGGGAVGLFGWSEALAPRGQERRRMAVNALLAVGVTAGLPLLAGGASLVPALAYAPYTEVHIEAAGASLTMPGRMAPQECTVRSMSCWLPTPNSQEPVFAGLWSLPEPADVDATALGRHWATLLKGDATRVEGPDGPPGAWTTYAFEISDPGSGRPAWRVIEHHRRRGTWDLVVGYYLKLDGSLDRRERLYRHVIDSVSVEDPPTLAEERRKYARNPGYAKRQYHYATALEEAGMLAEADELYGRLDTPADGWEWEAARRRLYMWNTYPEWPGDPAYVVKWLQLAPAADRRLHRRGVTWLARHGYCEEARTHVEGLQGADESLVASLQDALAPCPESPTPQ